MSLLLTSPPVFIVGMPRSGTTLVGTILNSHSQVSISLDTHYFDELYRKGERRRCLSDDRAFQTFVRYVLESENMDSFRLSPEERAYLYDSMVHAGERSHRVVLGTLLSYHAAQRGKSIFGEKTPTHMHYVDTIMASFPEARLIFVVRDPRDVVLSLRNVDWERGNMLEHLAHWRQSVRYIPRYAQAYGGQFAVVKYEDLLTAPEETARRLCAFLALPFEPGMLAYHQHEHANIDAEREPWKAKNLQPIDPKNQMKWKSYMTPREWAIIEAQVGTEIAQCGYPLTTRTLDLEARLHFGYLYLENLLLVGGHWMKRAWLRLTSSY